MQADKCLKNTQPKIEFHSKINKIQPVKVAKFKELVDSCK